MGPGLELLTAVMRHYQQVTGRQLSPARVMAWHLRQALGDALWHSEAGIPLTTTAHHRSGSTTWPRASAHSASTPKRHPHLTSANGTGEDPHTVPRRPEG